MIQNAMRYIFKFFICLVLVLAVAGPVFVGAQSTTPPTSSSTYNPAPLPINPTLPGFSDGVPISGEGGQGPAAIVANFYSFAFLIAGFLAFVMIVYGGVRYAFSGGSASSKEEGKDAIKQALLGLGLLLVAYLILRTINPDLTQLRMPTLPAHVPTPPAAGGASTTTPPGVTGCSTSCTCQQYLQYQQEQHPGETLPTTCTVGPGLQAVLGCLAALAPPITPSIAPSDHQQSTVGGSHNPNSCHFGGRNCIGIGHASDFSLNSGGGRTYPQIKAAVEQCGVSTGRQVACRYEDSAGNTVANPNFAHHIHCNVDNVTDNCGCT